MSDIHNGDICGRCGKAFKEDDDIVYCPECGTPVHKQCWTGECQNAFRHGIFHWESEAASDSNETESKSEGEAAAGAGFDIPSEWLNSNMGEILNEQERGELLKIKERSQESLYMDVSALELYSFIGADSFSRFHYFRRFLKMITTGKKISLNIFSCFLMPYYQFYNRMTLMGIVLTVVQVIMSVPEIAVMLSYSETTSTAMQSAVYAMDYLSLLLLLLKIVFLLFGDYFYLRFSVRRIKEIRTAYGGVITDEYLNALRRNGKPRMLNVLAGIAVMFFLTFLVMLLIFPNS